MTDLTQADLSAAHSAAESFLKAVMSGDEAAARALLITHEGQKIDFKTMHESTAGYKLGEAKAEGAQVVVVAIIHAAPGKDAPPALPLVLDRAAGTWKVDMGASITRMLGMDPEDLMKQMAQGLGDAMAKGMEAVAEGLSAALSSPGEAGAPAEVAPPKSQEKPKAAKKGAKRTGRK